MKILVVGGGSGGHITPAVAVVREILKISPRTRVEFWTDRKYYKNVVKITTEIGVSWGEESRVSGRRQYIQVRKVCAGKFHRYAGWKLVDYFKNFGTTLKDIVWGNICGFCGFVAGLVQSFFRMVGKKSRPDVVFLKGGFVGLPVGLVARLLKIPYVVHESDAVPGLANRLLMKHAAVVCMGIGEDEAHAPLADTLKAASRFALAASQGAGRPSLRSAKGTFRSSSPTYITVGIPVAPEFRKVSVSRQKALKKAFGFSEERPLVVMTGGSQGAKHMNEAMREILPEMLKFTSVGLVAGRERYEEMVDLKKYENWDKAKLASDFRMWAFNSAMDELMGAADVVISRAGATTIAELAALEKAVILVPFEKLPGSHQVKNAERLVKMGAVMMVGDERMSEQPGVLLQAAQKLVRSPKLRKELTEKLHATYRPDAAKKIAEILLEKGAGDVKKK